jgi:anaerobic magnesium-protoporphyrin IX monomethyl ester cyclase
LSNIALISLYGVENNGIRYISSLLKREGFKVSLVFFKKWVNNDIRVPSESEKEMLVSLLKELGADIVGISFTSPFFKIAADITEYIKKVLNVKVVWGGIHATVDPERCLEYCDAVCRGEGEYAMLDLVRNYAAFKGDSRLRGNDMSGGNDMFEGIKNICHKKNGKVVFEETRPLIQDLEFLPYQDYGDGDKFFIEKKLYKKDPLASAGELRIFASRGCPFNCSYCYNSIFRKLYGKEKYHRIRKVEYVISEIEYALSGFGRIKKIKFDDDTFVFPRDWIYEFCEKYKSRVGLPFEILYNAECLDAKMLEMLKGAGLIRVQAGIQTGSVKESEEVYGRHLPLEKIRQFAKVSKNLKLDVVYDVILDNPMADRGDKEAVVDFLLTLPRPFDLFIYSLTVFPGTELCRILLEKGLITPGEVEGEAQKSFYQFRLGFSYPRSKEDLFFACLVSLVSKSFIPRSLIRVFKKSRFLRKHPLPLKCFAQACNLAKLSRIFVKMLVRGDMNLWKIREYGLPKRFLIQ